jgi:hypothetical protein
MGTGGSRHAVRRLLFVGAVLAGLSPGGAMAATSHTMSGRLIGVPRGASTTIEAVAVRRDAVVAARTLRGSRYTVRVPAGPTFVLVRVVDIRRHRQLDAYTARSVTRSLRGINLRLRVARADDRVAAEAATAGSATGSNVTINTIPIIGPDGPLPGGAEAGFIAGALPVCHAHGGRLLDGSNVFKQGRQSEMDLAKNGQLDVNLLPWAQPVSDFGVNGQVSVGPDGGPLADINVVAQDGSVVHYVISGDPANWGDIGSFMSRLGDRILTSASDHRMACGQASAPPPPPSPAKLHCNAPKCKVCVTFSGSAEDSQTTPHNFAVAEQGTVSWDIEWLPSIAGNGEWDQIAPASTVSGSGSVDNVAGSQPQSCTTGFRLSRTFAPALAEQSTRSEITIGVPDPVLDSVGTGTGYPSIEPTNSACPPVFAALPPDFSLTVPLRHDTVTREVSGGGSYTPSDPSGKGSSTLKGTITVQVG